MGSNSKTANVGDIRAAILLTAGERSGRLIYPLPVATHDKVQCDAFEAEVRQMGEDGLVRMPRHARPCDWNLTSSGCESARDLRESGKFDKLIDIGRAVENPKQGSDVAEAWSRPTGANRHASAPVRSPSAALQRELDADSGMSLGSNAMQ